ncbi:cytochrome c-type biogenesis protein CcmH [Temperatibacter marinus]|uniref:Cytochrome c-type biogenesis protein n=1 Tax=Temperatibacter marinus TaxID=1456591 RepID=A0AA52EIB8_9PROT|nr:cytochrome c-type biogenesis protein [Temperatibacter marinus]WND03072.1 cytochrome c-type biogenesis protein CcmH [Temperatibacter marinus]
MIRLLFLVLFILTAPVFAQASNPEALPDPVQEQLAREIMKEIRCLQCQNQSIVDSNADLAKDLRKLIRIKVSEGLDRQAIKDYLVARYGDWILLKPPVKSSTYLLWGSPLILLLGMSFFLIRRRITPSRPEDHPLTEAEELRLQSLLEDTERQLAEEETKS